MSQGEVARRARVSAKFIGEMERGRANPSLVTMLLVAGALDCDLQQLFQPDGASNYITFRATDVQRGRDAVAVLASMLAARKNAPRRSSR